MKLNSTDLDRESKGWELPDDRDATKERIIILITTFLIGMVLGVSCLMAYYVFTGKTCSAYPYCSVHKTK